MGAMRILVVEDQADNRELMERLLRLNGHEVLGAGGVQEALAVAAGGPLDLLIADVGLPDGTGCDLLREMRKSRPGLRALAVTGHDEERLVDACRQAGFFDFVRKPVLFSRLLAAVDAARAAGRDSAARDSKTPAGPR